MENLALCSQSFIVIIFAALILCACCVQIQGFDSLLQLPQSGLARIKRFRSKRVFFVDDFGAKGDGFHNDTQAWLALKLGHKLENQAFKNAWEIACSFPARTRIVIPVGFTFLVHPVDLAGPCKSKITLEISGSLVAPKDPAFWKGLNRRKWIYFHGVNHLTINGGGTINGKGHAWWAQSCKMNSTNPCRHAPTAITFHRCKDLKLKNLNVIHGQQMHIAFTNCMRITASSVNIKSPAYSPNTDGIHISASRRVEIKDSVVATGDDCISIVSNSSQIKIRNITCGPGHGISIGSLGKSGSSSLVYDVMVDGALLSNTDNGVRIKTWQGGNGNARDIKFQNIFMKNVSNPIIIDQYYCDSQLPCENQTSAVNVESISFIHIKGTSATEEAIKFSCSDDSPCKDLYLEDIQLQSHNGGSAKSFCWEAYGSSQGLVDPPPCFSDMDGFILQKFPLSNHIVE